MMGEVWSLQLKKASHLADLRATDDRVPHRKGVWSILSRPDLAAHRRPAALNLPKTHPRLPGRRRRHRRRFPCGLSARRSCGAADDLSCFAGPSCDGCHLRRECCHPWKDVQP